MMIWNKQKDKWKQFVRRWKKIEHDHDLPYVLNQLRLNLTFEERVFWFEQLLKWMQDLSYVQMFSSSSPNQLPIVRLKFILQLVERNEEWKRALSTTMRIILQKSEAVELFTQAGMSQRHGFFSEIGYRLLQKFKPSPPRPEQLSELVNHIYSNVEEAHWLGEVNPESLVQLQKLILDGQQELGIDHFKNIKSHLHQSLIILGSQVCALGLSYEIRTRMQQHSVENTPFLLLLGALQDRIELEHIWNSEDELRILEIIVQCREKISQVYGTLESTGVSVSIVYSLDRLTKLLNRIESIIRVLTPHDQASQVVVIARFLRDVIVDQLSNTQVGHVLSNNVRLMAKKVVERTGVTGEHYIARTRHEYFHLLQSAFGGGVVVVLTTFLKYSFGKLRLPAFFEVTSVGLSYATTFIGMQFLGFTLATKQPSVTASTLAHKISQLSGPNKGLEFIIEVRRIIRSQFISILGNIGAAVPFTILLHYLYFYMTGTTFFDEAYATYKIKSYHPIFSLTIPFAMLTGAILWLSSLVGGWLENWIVFNRIPDAISHNRSLNILFGKERTAYWSQWWLKQISGVGSSVALGFLLALTPLIGKFFGLPLDIRHVTLSSSALTLAALSAYQLQADLSLLGYACVGIMLTGLLNFFVSFGLALFLAARAKGLNTRSIALLFLRVWKDFRAKPLSYIFPATDAQPGGQ